MTNDVIALATTLMQEASITPNDANCQTILAKRLSALGFQCEHLRFDDTDNLWARLGDAKPLFVFAGHTDVVPPGPLDKWTTPPFTPTVRDGILYGRGAVDMKAAIAAAVIATEKFLTNYPKFHGAIGFLITSDEEGPATNGTQKAMEVLAKRKEKIDYCVIGEPSSDQTVGDQIRIGRRGSLHGTLIIHGKQGHVAHPHLADNPIHRGAIALHELASETWDQGNTEFPPTSFQITNAHSGTGAKNVIPGSLEVFFNFRHGTAITVDTIKQRVNAILQKHQLQYDLTWSVGAQPFLTKQGKLIKATETAIKTVTGQTVKLSTGGGTSDGRFIAPTGAEVVELGASHHTAHHIDENIPVSDLLSLVAIYEKILVQILT